LTELLTNYGEITEVWFDGACGEGPNGKRQVYDWQSYYKVIRKLQPNAVIFGMAPDLRWVGTETGYGRETEWNVIPIDLRNTDENFIRNSKYPLDQIYKPGDLTDADLGSREKILKAKGLYWYPAETDVSIRPGWFYHKSQDDKVKTPQQLIDIYFSSVGRNGVLLLNVPPNKDGLISYNDVVNLTEMKRGLDETFKINFAANALTKSTTMKTNKSSYWTTANKQDTASIIFNLQKLETFNVAMLQEEIRVGQRIEKFYLESWDGSKWNRFCEGTTVGYKRLLRFEQVKTDRVRLVIEKSRMNPTISNFGLFKMN
jgi:alpha-L-fucosidase